MNCITLTTSEGKRKRCSVKKICSDIYGCSRGTPDHWECVGRTFTPRLLYELYSNQDNRWTPFCFDYKHYKVKYHLDPSFLEKLKADAVLYVVNNKP